MFGGCAKQSTRPASAEMVDLHVLSCPQLQESTANWYLVLYYEGERIENGKGSQLKDKLPTASVVSLEFDEERWKELQPGTGHVALYITPNTLPPEA